MSSDQGPLAATRREKTGKAIAIALNAVPIGGGVMSDVASTLIANRQSRRLNNFLSKLADDFNRLESLLNDEFMKSEDFEDLVEDVFTKASDARRQEKLDAFRAIFMNACIDESPSYNEIEEIIVLVSSWQVRHILLLKAFANPNAARLESLVFKPLPSEPEPWVEVGDVIRHLFPEWTDDQIQRTWSDLRDSRIIHDDQLGMLVMESERKNLANRLSTFGKIVARYLKSPVENP